MRNIYEQHYGHKIYVVPPIVPDDLILRKPSKLNDTGSQQRGILIGNVWDPVWLTRLRETIRDSGYQIDWPCMNPNAMVSDRTLGSLKEELAADGIFLIDALSVEELDYELKRRPFAVMPSGTLEAEEETENISRLSLPSRIPYMISSAHLPIVVLGSQETAAARFVERFGLGHCARYEGSQFKKAVESICKHDSQVAIRERARKLAPTFSAANMENWIWDSLDHSEPIDDRFESTFCTRPGEFAYFVDPPAPQDVHWCQRTLWQTLKRLKKMKFEPVTVIDAGASTGIWSSTSSKVFPNAHYVMIDPLMPHYSQETRDTYYSQINSFQLVEAALSNEPGEAEFFVSDNLCDSSLLKVDESLRPTRRTKVQLRTLDELANENAWSGSTLLKIDVPYAEHLVLAGGKDFIRSNVDAVIVELNLEREHPQAKTYREMLDLMDELGFQLVDETEGWRCPLDGRLEQKDSVFVRRSRLETT
jgi:FkbM family methyltransferase